MTDVPHVPLDAIARRALEWVANGAVVGLGTGHAATAFIHELAMRLRKGLRVRGVPTSQASADLAIKLGIPLTSLDQSPTIDVDVDGADEVDPQGNLIKGYGGALVRERIVAASAAGLSSWSAAKSSSRSWAATASCRSKSCRSAWLPASGLGRPGISTARCGSMGPASES